VGALADAGAIQERGVIFSAERAEEYSRYLLMDGVEPPYWTPSAGEIESLEAKLRDFLAKSGEPDAAQILFHLDTYKRQYIGFTVGGAKWILVNAFCGDEWKRNGRWREQLVAVLDGGRCYFRAIYNRAKSRFEILKINGEA